MIDKQYAEGVPGPGRLKTNPYKDIGTAFVTTVLAGARTQTKSHVGTLSERLTNYTYYLTENQQDAGDALLIMDLHDAIGLLRKNGL